jgi:hypothetical protein
VKYYDCDVQPCIPNILSLTGNLSPWRMQVLPHRA